MTDTDVLVIDSYNSYINIYPLLTTPLTPLFNAIRKAHLDHT
jgi:hypothetical protein